MAERSID